MFEDSWFQLEGAPWRPLRHPLDAVRHAFNFVQYKLTRSQVISCFYRFHRSRICLLIIVEVSTLFVVSRSALVLKDLA